MEPSRHSISSRNRGGRFGDAAHVSQSLADLRLPEVLKSLDRSPHSRQLQPRRILRQEPQKDHCAIGQCRSAPDFPSQSLEHRARVSGFFPLLAPLLQGVEHLR